MSIVLTSPPATGEWVKLSSSTSVSPIDFASLPVYTAYKVVLKQGDDATSGMNIRINDDAGANYTYLRVFNASVSEVANTTTIATGTSALCDAYQEFYFTGKTRAVANGRSGFFAFAGSDYGAATVGNIISGSWGGGNATQITKISLWSFAGTVTAEIWGRTLQ
jgi:hypothetical protein